MATMAGEQPCQFSELNSFVGKFARLWQGGFNATLSMQSIAGEANVTLQVGLGKVKQPFQHQVYPHHHRVPDAGRSRQRRRQRRADARLAAAAEATVNQNKEDSAEEVTTKVDRGVQNFLKSLIFKTLNLPKRLFSMLAAYPRSNILGLILNVLLPRLFTI